MKGTLDPPRFTQYFESSVTVTAVVINHCLVFWPKTGYEWVFCLVSHHPTSLSFPGSALELSRQSQMLPTRSKKLGRLACGLAYRPESSLILSGF